MGKFVNLTGKRFGRWLVLGRAPNHTQPNGQQKIMWNCICDCGKQGTIEGGSLRSGNSTSCGCYNRELILERCLIDMIGRRFGRLVVLERGQNKVHPSGRYRITYICRCDCGELVEVIGDYLRSGMTKSCGCLRVEMGKNKLDNLTGKRFGRLVVLYRVEDYISPKGKHAVQYKCVCDCGKEVNVTGERLRSDNTKSCGCYHDECSTGENHWNYKGGPDKIIDQIRISIEYTKWRNLVLQRDNYTCRYSDAKGHGNLNVHHVKPLWLIIKENNITTMEEARACKELWDVSNGITLLDIWHLPNEKFPQAFHTIYNSEGSTAEDFKIWFLAITPEFAKELKNVS